MGGVLSTSHVAKSFIGTGLLIPDAEDEKGAGEIPLPGAPAAPPGATGAAEAAEAAAAAAAAAGWC